MRKVYAEVSVKANGTWVCEAGNPHDKTIRGVVGFGETYEQAVADARRQYSFPIEIEVVED